MRYNEDGDQQKTVAPVTKGSVINLKMLGTGSRGDLFGKVSGFIIFVHGSTETDLDKVLAVEIIEVKEKCAFAKKI